MCFGRSFRSQVDNAKYKCKHFVLVHFWPLPEVVKLIWPDWFHCENAHVVEFFDQILTKYINNIGCALAWWDLNCRLGLKMKNVPSTMFSHHSWFLTCSRRIRISLMAIRACFPVMFICELQKLILSIRSKDLEKTIHSPAHRPSPWRNQDWSGCKWTTKTKIREIKISGNGNVCPSTSDPINQNKSNIIWSCCPLTDLL